jgi:peroxiredoxin
MAVPENAPKAIFDYAWKFKVNGEEKTIVTQGDYPQVDGEFIGVETEEIQKGYEPPIHDFTLEMSGEDHTTQLMKEEKLLMVVAYDLAKTETDVFGEIKSITDRALDRGYTVIGMSASNEQWTLPLIQKNNLNFPFYFTDETTLKTIVRSNPGLLVLNKGTILQKVHYNDLNELVLD